MNTRLRTNLVWNSLFAFSVLCILFTAWYGFIRTEPAPQTINTRREIARLQANTAAFELKERDARKEIAQSTWNLTAEELGSITLDRLTGLAERHHLTISGFRTDRTKDHNALQEVPFGVVVEGTFPNTMNFVAALEDPRSKLMVDLLQLSSADSQSDRVTATIGLSGFLNSEGL